MNNVFHLRAVEFVVNLTGLCFRNANVMSVRKGSALKLNIPNIVMRSAFKYNCKCVNVCLINAGSVFPKIYEFRRIFETCQAHLIITPETWFKSYRSNASIALEGYDVIRNDRVNRRSGCGGLR